MAIRSDVPQRFTTYSLALELIFFGNEVLATGVESEAPILASLMSYGHHVEAIVLHGKPGKQSKAIQNIAKQHSIPVHFVQSGSQLRSLSNNFKSELGVLAAFGALVPEQVIADFPLGIVNVHPSLLPTYRGSTPIETALLDGVNETGVSFMKLAPELDAGPLYWQQSVPINQDITKQELYEQLAQLAANELPDQLNEIASGSLKPQPQSGSPSFTKTITKKDGVIDWSQPAEQIERQVRAFSGWPGSQTTLAGKEVTILAAHTTPSNDPNKKPGEFEVVNKNIIMVECGQGSLCIEKLKPASKKEMSAGDFARGYLKN